MGTTTGWQSLEPGSTNLTRVGIERRNLRPDDVAVRVDHCGVCHSDLRRLQGLLGETHLVPGHEATGVVTAVGRVLPEEGVVGELAAIDPAGALAVLAHAADVARVAGRQLHVQPRGRGCAHDAVAPYLDQGELPQWFYARVPDLAALLEGYAAPVAGA